jgi:hypothetical protein
VEGINIRRFKRIMKYRKIRTQPLCGEYKAWVLYLSFEEEDCGLLFYMILERMWLGELFWGKVCVYEEKKRTWNNSVFGVM